MASDPHPFVLPRLVDLARHAAPRIVEGTLGPLVAFWLALQVLGTWGALAAALAWTYGAAARRILYGEKVPGLLIVGLVTATLRTAVALATNSVTIYFLQPALGTAAVALAFVVSVVAGRPLAQRLAVDFCPLPDAWLRHPQVRRFFLRISLLWGIVLLMNAAASVWLLLSQSVTIFVFAKPILSATIIGSAIAFSIRHCHRSLHRHGLVARRGAVATSRV